MTIIEDQGPVIAFLQDALAGETAPIRTHISVVLRGGTRVFKLKRAVRFSYVDFSTPDLRLDSCRRELELNRRTAPALYRAVRRITRTPDGDLAFDGTGPLVDAVVEMRRFDDDQLLDRVAARGELTPAILTSLARTIHGFHASAEASHRRGGAAIMRRILDLNERAFAATDLPVGNLNQRFAETLGRHATLLDARAEAGAVRRCHGDLHLRNIVLIDGVPTLFDCLEFDEELSTIDLLYDLAFLLMDLCRSGSPGFANLVFNRYLDEDGTGGLALMPFFMAVRAAIRAHVSATQAAETDGDMCARLQADALAYLRLAEDLMAPKPARLVAIGGLSGTGKSTVAHGIAARLGPAPGARILSSDRIRKRLMGVAPEQRLPETAYRPEMARQVYATQAEQARAALAQGAAVIADAVFADPTDRAAIEAVAAACRVPFTGLWLAAAAAVREERVAARHGDPSDATVAVVRTQSDVPCPGTWTRVPADGTPDAVIASALRVLG